MLLRNQYRYLDFEMSKACELMTLLNYQTQDHTCLSNLFPDTLRPALDHYYLPLLKQRALMFWKILKSSQPVQLSNHFESTVFQESMRIHFGSESTPRLLVTLLHSCSLPAPQHPLPPRWFLRRRNELRCTVLFNHHKVILRFLLPRDIFRTEEGLQKKSWAD